MALVDDAGKPGAASQHAGFASSSQRRLTPRERNAIMQRVWERLAFEPIGPEPEAPELRRAWRVEGQTRATLNFLGVARTLDEHAEEQGLEAIRRFPLCAACAKDEVANDDWVLRGDAPFQVSVCKAHGREHKPYFRIAIDYWHRKAAESRPALAEKSRQILLSWTLGVGSHLWLALTRPGVLIGIQSETLDKARKLLTKGQIMYQSLPRELQRFGPMSDSTKAQARKIEDAIEFKHVDARGAPAPSYLLALPCKANAVRSYTFSALFMDECQHWESDEDFEDSYGAAQATYKGGGRLTAISSVGHPSRYHYRLCRGLVEVAA
jgi:hypothetical protein